MQILVTGGCGYIGSHVVRQLSEAGHRVVVIDDLSSGFRKALLQNETFILGSFGDPKVLSEASHYGPFDAVFHFAANVYVPESVINPIKYYKNNTMNSLMLFEWIVEQKNTIVILSSTGAVYGDPSVLPVVESLPPDPQSPYAWSKAMDEQMLRDIAQAHGTKFSILRYFNVAGADPSLRLGQRTINSIHLIKVASEVALGKRAYLEITGTDFPTNDGTGVRDYIHVEDLASAHLSVLNYLAKGSESETFNCGYGVGYSVKEVISSFERANSLKLKVKVAARRPGDVACVYANPQKILSKTTWRPRFNQLDFICKSAYEWELKLARES